MVALPCLALPCLGWLVDDFFVANDSAEEASSTEEFVTETFFSEGVVKKRTRSYFLMPIIIIFISSFDISFPRMIDLASPQPAQRADYCELIPYYELY